MHVGLNYAIVKKSLVLCLKYLAALCAIRLWCTTSHQSILLILPKENPCLTYLEEINGNDNGLLGVGK